MSSCGAGLWRRRSRTLLPSGSSWFLCPPCPAGRSRASAGLAAGRLGCFLWSAWSRSSARRAAWPASRRTVRCAACRPGRAACSGARLRVWAWRRRGSPGWPRWVWAAPWPRPASRASGLSCGGLCVCRGGGRTLGARSSWGLRAGGLRRGLSAGLA